MNFILIFLLLIISSNENLYAYNQNVSNHVDSVKLALSKNLSENQVANLKTSASPSNNSKANQVPELASKIDFETFLDLTVPNWTVANTSIYISSKQSFDFKKVSPKYINHILFLPLTDYLNNQLKDLIPIYNECGVDAIMFETFTYDSYKLNLAVYNCKSINAARTLYSILKSGSTNSIRHGSISSEDDSSISLCQNNFFVTIKTQTAEEEIEKNAALNLAKQITKLSLVNNNIPNILNRLPSYGKIEGSEKLIIGEESARYFFSIPLFDDLKLSNLISGAVCDYRMEDPYKERLRILLLKFKDHKSATEVYDEYIASLNQSDSIKKIRLKFDSQDSGSSPVSDKSYPQIYKTNSKFMLCQTGDNYFLIIKNARKAQSLIEFARTILY